jgi:hypothetical protein
MGSIFVEAFRALGSVWIAVLNCGLVLGGLAGIYLSSALVPGPEGRSLVQIDPLVLGVGLLAVFLGLYVIPKWCCGWARPSLPGNQGVHDTPVQTDRATPDR